jgi:hypothetical protein
MRYLPAIALVLVTAACGSSPANHAAQQTGAAAYSACIRAHGVLAYPDPGSNGLLPKKSLQQLGVSSTVFQSAQKACVQLAPNGGQPTQAQVAQYRSTMLVYARCIRTHGVPNMPDPDSRGHLDIGPGTGVDVNSPKFQAAYLACKSKLSP